MKDGFNIRGLQLPSPVPWCYSPSVEGLFVFSGRDDSPHLLTCSEVGQLSPDGSLLTALKVRDGKKFKENQHRRFQRFDDTDGYSFCHMSVKDRSIAKGSLTNISDSGYGSLLSQSHPFLCSWLPGSLIYAASAAGCVRVVDGHRHELLSYPMSVHGPDDHSCDDLPAFDSLSWSPERSSLAVAVADQCTIYSFGSATEQDHPEQRRRLHFRASAEFDSGFQDLYVLKDAQSSIAYMCMGGEACQGDICLAEFIH